MTIFKEEELAFAYRCNYLLMCLRIYVLSIDDKNLNKKL